MRGSPSASAIRTRCGRWARRSGGIRCRSSCRATACGAATAGSAAISFGGELKRRLAELERCHARPRGLDRDAHRLPRGVPPGGLHASGAARGLRIGRGRALGGLSALQGLQAAERRVSARPSVPLPAPFHRPRDWRAWTGPALEAQLDERGYARTPPLLTQEECGALVELYGDERRFRSRVDMARYRFGVGEYQYFASPLPGARRGAPRPRLSASGRHRQSLGSRRWGLPDATRPTWPLSSGSAPSRARRNRRRSCCVIRQGATTACTRTSTAPWRFRSR